MWKDPIVEEIRSIRKQIEHECDNDLRKIVERLRQRELQHPSRIVREIPSKKRKQI